MITTPVRTVRVSPEVAGAGQLAADPAGGDLQHGHEPEQVPAVGRDDDAERRDHDGPAGVLDLHRALFDRDQDTVVLTVADVGTVVAAAQAGIPSPAFSSSLAYYDGLRADRLPAALIQGQRDFFGAHTYKRVDEEGVFHTLGSGDRSEIETEPSTH